jgi:hypothetical protein
MCGKEVIEEYMFRHERVVTGNFPEIMPSGNIGYFDSGYYMKEAYFNYYCSGHCGWNKQIRDYSGDRMGERFSGY